MADLGRLFDAVEMLRKHVKKDMPSQHIALLLTVSQHPGVTMPELCELLEMPQGTLSRNVKSLSSYVDRSERVARVVGLGLLYSEQGKASHHSHTVFLTEKGHAVIDELDAIFNSDQQETKQVIPRNLLSQKSAESRLVHLVSN